MSCLKFQTVFYGGRCINNPFDKITIQVEKCYAIFNPITKGKRLYIHIIVCNVFLELKKKNHRISDVLCIKNDFQSYHAMNHTATEPLR